MLHTSFLVYDCILNGSLVLNLRAKKLGMKSVKPYWFTFRGTVYIPIKRKLVLSIESREFYTFGFRSC